MRIKVYHLFIVIAFVGSFYFGGKIDLTDKNFKDFTVIIPFAICIATVAVYFGCLTFEYGDYIADFFDSEIELFKRKNSRR